MAERYTPGQGIDPPFVPQPIKVADNAQPITPPGAWFDASAFRGMVYSHPASQTIRHLVAYRSAQNANNETGGAGDAGKYEYVESDNAGQYRVVIGDIASNRAYRERQGEFQDGDISIMYMASEIPLRQDDIVTPLGCRGDGSDIATLPQAEIILHAGSEEYHTKLPFLITVEGAGENEVTLIGEDQDILLAALLISPGDTIISMGVARIVLSVSDRTMLLSASPDESWIAVPVLRARDRLLHQPVRAVSNVRFADGVIADPQSYSITADGLLWEPPGSGRRVPAYREKYSIRYTSYPQYVVGKRLSSTSFLTGGGEMPYIVSASLIQPDRHRV